MCLAVPFGGWPPALINAQIVPASWLRPAQRRFFTRLQALADHFDGTEAQLTHKWSAEAAAHATTRAELDHSRRSFEELLEELSTKVNGRLRALSSTAHPEFIEKLENVNRPISSCL